MFKGSKFETTTAAFRQDPKHAVWYLDFLNFDIVSNLGALDLGFPAFPAGGGEKCRLGVELPGFVGTQKSQGVDLFCPWPDSEHLSLNSAGLL